MNLMRTTRMDNLRAVNRMDSIKRRKANEPAEQTVIHKELAPKPSRVEIHTIEPTTTTKRSLSDPSRLMEAVESNALSVTWDRDQQEQAPAVTIGKSVRETVTKIADAQVETVLENTENTSHPTTQARYEEVIPLYQGVYQPSERMATTSILA